MLVVFPSMTLNVWNFSNLPKLVAYLILFYQVLNFCYVLILFYPLCNLISLYVCLLCTSHFLRSLPSYRAQAPCTTVRLLTHVLCKPTHFFFHSFIAAMSYSLQTSSNSLMKDWADKYHLWGTPTRSPSRSNSR